MRLLIALACAVASIVAADQKDAPAAPAFDVASVKKSPPPTGTPTLVVCGARKGDSWNTQNATLRRIIRSAHGNRYQMEGQIVGGPAWLDTDRFDIAAKMPPMTTAEDMLAMVQALLADRFTLQTHSETRERRFRNSWDSSSTRDASRPKFWLSIAQSSRRPTRSG
jgi:hypothetical protein